MAHPESKPCSPPRPDPHPQLLPWEGRCGTFSAHAHVAGGHLILGHMPGSVFNFSSFVFIWTVIPPVPSTGQSRVHRRGIPVCFVPTAVSRALNTASSLCLSPYTQTGCVLPELLVTFSKKYPTKILKTVTECGSPGPRGEGPRYLGPGADPMWNGTAPTH